jgi:formate hydrogenlyase subunit 6/NADH:ubiquinone oxidoreductase subunit I
VVASGEQGGVHKLGKETCVDCGACDTVCPVEVIKWETTA